MESDGGDGNLIGGCCGGIGTDGELGAGAHGLCPQRRF